jgi:hypothetical protein
MSAMCASVAFRTSFKKSKKKWFEDLKWIENNAHKNGQTSN